MQSKPEQALKAHAAKAESQQKQENMGNGTLFYNNKIIYR